MTQPPRVSPRNETHLLHATTIDHTSTTSTWETQPYGSGWNQPQPPRRSRRPPLRPARRVLIVGGAMLALIIAVATIGLLGFRSSVSGRIYDNVYVNEIN